MNLDELEAAARAATPGPWMEDQETGCLRARDGEWQEVACFGHDYDDYGGWGPAPYEKLHHTPDANPRYIAAASPDVVLALIARIKNTRTEIRAAVDRILAGEDPRAVFEDFGVFDDALTPREEPGRE